jgi:myo-inositol-1(or 4)-monophosphatase
MVCTSIGLAVKGVPVIGVIYNPFLNQLVSSTEFPAAPVTSQAEHTQYSAAKGHGAWLNEEQQLPLTGKAKPLESLGQAL